MPDGGPGTEGLQGGRPPVELGIPPYGKKRGRRRLLGRPLTDFH